MIKELILSAARSMGIVNKLHYTVDYIHKLMMTLCAPTEALPWTVSRLETKVILLSEQAKGSAVQVEPTRKPLRSWLSRERARCGFNGRGASHPTHCHETERGFDQKLT